MTEVEWLTEDRPGGMLRAIGASASDRKLLLFNCASCRNVWNHLDSEDQEAVKMAEGVAEDSNSIRKLEKDLERLCLAELSIAGLHDHPVEPELEVLLKTRTTIRLRLIGRGWGIGSLAHMAARSSTKPSNLRPKEKFGDALTMDMAPEEKKQASIVRDIFGNPFHPVAFDPRWRTSDVVDLARGIYEAKAFDKMLMLADALMDAGCEDEQIIAHCKGDGPHVRGCWVVDLVLGKA